MNVKLLELRDVGTFIPIMCIDMTSEDENEKYLLNRLGFDERRLIQLVWISNKRTEYDPFQWGDRTFFVAHKYIVENWNNLHSGDVVDVQYILGETESVKQSEKHYSWSEE